MSLHGNVKFTAASTHLSDEEEWSKETLLEILKVSTSSSDLSGRYMGLQQKERRLTLEYLQSKKRREREM